MLYPIRASKPKFKSKNYKTKIFWWVSAVFQQFSLKSLESRTLRLKSSVFNQKMTLSLQFRRVEKVKSGISLQFTGQIPNWQISDTFEAIKPNKKNEYFYSSI